MQKILINSVGERDYLCARDLLPASSTSHVPRIQDFVILSLDGSREVDNKLDEGKDVKLTHIWTTTVFIPQRQSFRTSSSCSLWNGTGFQRDLVMTWSAVRRRWLSLSIHTAPLIQRVQSTSSTAGRSSLFTNHFAKWMIFLEHVRSTHLRTISSLGVVKFHPHLQMTFIDWNWKKERVTVLTLMKGKEISTFISILSEVIILHIVICK